VIFNWRIDKKLTGLIRFFKQKLTILVKLSHKNKLCAYFRNPMHETSTGITAMKVQKAPWITFLTL